MSSRLLLTRLTHESYEYLYKFLPIAVSIYTADNLHKRRRKHVTLTEAYNDAAVMQQQQSMHQQSSTNSEPAIIYDFVIIGNGTTGQSALASLQQTCPNARIAVVDPIRAPTNSTTIAGFASSVLNINAQHRKVTLQSNTVVGYKHGLLIATGSRGAPMPYYLCDDNSNSDAQVVHHLHPTIQHDLVYSSKKHNLLTDQVRQLTREVVRRGQSVAILGSGWDAVDLVLNACNNATSKAKIYLVFGHFGPACHTLPSYLSTAINKRLQKLKRVTILDRSLVRYISITNAPKLPIHLHTGKSYDFMDTTVNKVNQIIVAPDKQGTRGNAAIPTNFTPSFLANSSKGRPWYQPWSQLAADDNKNAEHKNNTRQRSLLINCYRDDGRIMVNTELMACSKVYAAGSVAKYPNSMTGHATVAGTGIYNSIQCGKIAANNMAVSYLDANNSTSSSSSSLLFSTTATTKSNKSISIETVDPLPIWRSDIRPSDAYSNINIRKEQHDKPFAYSALDSIGIRAMAVGDCDSENYNTHGVWWTNQAAQKRFLRLIESNDSLSEEEKRAKLKELRRPLFGIGIVYYMSKTGQIQGIMTWGVPYTMADADHTLNEALVNEIKTTICTNGGFGDIKTDLDATRMSTYLEGQSKKLLGIGFTGHQSDDNDDKSTLDLTVLLKSLPRPLHRHTEIRSTSVRSQGLRLQRSNDNSVEGVMGKDLFAQYYDKENMFDSPPPKPIAGVGFAAPDATSNITKRNTVSSSSYKSSMAMYNYALFDHYEQQWEKNERVAIPPREDAIWIRKGDESRSVSSSTQLDAAYGSAAASEVPLWMR